MVGSIYGSTDTFDYTEVKEKSSDDGSVVVLRLFIREMNKRVTHRDILPMVDAIKVDFPDLSDYVVRVMVPVLDADVADDVDEVYDVQLCQRKQR